MAIIEALYALAAEVDAREECSRHHSKKVCEYATEIASHLGFSNKEIDIIRTSARLHDIGKIGLKTSDKLLGDNDPEWERIRAHPYMAVIILRNVDGLEECISIIHRHHERYDGTGYPDQLIGENIPLGARILAVADVYDAMTSPRPYRPAYSSKEVLEYIKQTAGSHFDPKVVDAFLSIKLPESVGSPA